MATVFTSNLRLALPTNGTEAGTWGNTLNDGVTSLIDAAISGTTTVAMTGADYTLTTADGATDEARRMFIKITGAPGAARNVICPAVSKLYFVTNSSTGGFAQTFKTAAGTGISVPNGESKALYCDGTNVLDAITISSGVSLSGTNTWTGAQTFTNSLMKLKGSSTGVTTFTSANSSATDYTITIPAVTATLATLAGTETLTNKTLTYAGNTLTGVQPTLVSGTSIKTINSTSLLGSGDITVSGGSLTLLNSGGFTPTVAANADFLNTFSSTYDNYLIICEGLGTSVTGTLNMRFAVAGSVDTGANYFTPGESLTSGAVSALILGGNFFATGLGGGCIIEVNNVNATTGLKTGFSRCSAEASSGQVRYQTSGIGYSAANAISGFRLYWSTGGNFTATGKIFVYGYNKT